MADYDQTSPDWRRNARSGELGTGILLEAVDIGGAQALQARLIGFVSYAECLRQAEGMVAFKWIPRSIAAANDLMNEACGGECIDTCVKGGCICGPDGVCHKAAG